MLKKIEAIIREDKVNDVKDALAEIGIVGYPTESGYGGARTRAFLKVQDGCHNFCAYCIVPFVRNKEICVPPEEVVNEVKKRVEEGYQEVVLTGTEIGAYGCGGLDLSGLLKRILAETDIQRLRLSSLQPQEIASSLINLWRSGRLCPHFNLSLQSGSDSVLVRMKRRYTIKDYKRAVDLIRSGVPHAAITTDIIVGFPGETATEFQESYEFCRRVGFARVHVFSYSKRRGTSAAAMPDQIPEKVKKERSRQMLALAKESAQSFHQRFLGRTMAVLWEQKSNGVWSGYTGNYIKVYTRSDENLTNRLMLVTIEKLWRDGVWGKTILGSKS